MKRKTLLLFAIASVLMLAFPIMAWSDGLNNSQGVNGVKKLPYPLATKAVPASMMEYDSVAKCFIVRDTIMNDDSRSSMTIDTRAASAYTEAGVEYGYFGNQLSSDDMDEMKNLLAPWTEEFENLDIDGILSPAPGKETWYMQIVGVDTAEIDKKNGEMRIYNDIGTTYNYKTISIDGSALRGNEYIKKIVFEDCASASANANTMLNMVIHDGAFQGCKNLREISMYYYVTKGSNYYEALKPTDVYVGSNVFDGCHEDFRIVVAPDMYDDFVNDPNWGKYADMIVASSLTPSMDEPTIIKGVKYGYFGDQLSSNDMDAMKQIVEPWTAYFRNLYIDDVLQPDPDDETWYMQIVGVDDSYIKKNNGEMRIFNDIGDTYDYKTISIDRYAMSGNENIERVVFEDCASSSANAGTRLKMAIHEGAFKDCKNLKEFNMYYYVTEGTNRYDLLYPWDVYVGEIVFDGCHENFRIVVAPQLYDVFVNDPNWSQYADMIVASNYLPTNNNPIVFEGVTYDYAANSLNTLPTSELTRLQSSWWNAAIIGVEIAMAIATYGMANTAVVAYEAPARTAYRAALAASKEAMEEAIGGSLTFAQYISISIQQTSPSALALFKLNELATAEAAFNTAISSSYTCYMAAAGIYASSAAGVNGLSYVANTLGNKARRDRTWLLTGQWLWTENKHTIYHMYVKDVDNNETVTLYNDIGSAYNYKTVAIGNSAFHNKDKIKTINFKDVNTGEMYASMTVLIPDQAFKGCTSLETLDLIMYSNYTDRYVALGPENFIVCGEDIFTGCDTTKLKIRIGSEKYEEFAENTFWGKYKNCFELVDVTENVDFTTHGAQYSYSFENNSLKRETYLGEHNIEHVHIVGQDSEYLDGNMGEVALFNDAGSYNNYKLDYVKKKAFYGSQSLKGISMFDLKGAAGFGDSYSELALMVEDSAFAQCPNLEYINMLYFRTDGKNSVEPMSPYRVKLGKDVFKDSPKFKVKMVNTAVDEFMADTAWARYEDRFLPSFIMTDDDILKDIFKDCGMQYYSPVWDEKFDIYDVMNVTDHSILNGKFKGKKFEAFREFKAFECTNLYYIGESLFEACDKLQVIDLPSTITTIGTKAFYGCSLLDDVVIPASVTVIHKNAFGNCTSLRSLTFLSEQPATLWEEVFAGMPDDYVLYVPAKSVETYKSAWSQYAEHIQSVANKHTGIWEITLEAPETLAEKLGLSITGTDPLMISGNYSKYDSLKIAGPMNGTDIGVIRFLGGRDVNNCEPVYAGSLRYLDIYDADIKKDGEDYNQDGDNDYITEDDCIDTYMFWELDKLETLILPKSVTKIKDNAFKDCDNLQRLVIGDNTRSIGEEVTHDSPKLREVILLCGEAPATDDDAWSKDTKINVFYAPYSYFDHISGSHAYYTRGDSISYAFEDDALMYALAEKRIYTTNDLASIKSVDNLIAGNIHIKKFNELGLADKVKELGDNSLSGCSNLEEVMLPFTVNSISAGAFSGCTSLMKINVICDTIPTLAENAFESLPNDFVICVKVGMEEDYRKAWPQYADHIQGFRQHKLDIKVVTVTQPGTLGEAMGFSVDMDSNNDVGRISGDVISISALKVIGPINGKDIAVLRMLGGREEEDADEVLLARMTYLDLYDATICTDPDRICFNRDGINDYVENDNEIPEHMFWKLDKLQTVILPKNVTKIDDNAFYDCLNLETIVVGDATTAIGNDAFGQCKRLKNIVFLCDEKPELDSDAFTDPISDMPYQVERMYVAASLYQGYVTDLEYTTHAKEICTNYEDDALFRAYGSHAVMTDDQLQRVFDIDGWFNHHTGVTDLRSLEKSSIDTLKASSMSVLEDLQMIALPSTLSVVEDNTFAENTKLQWADFTKCSNAGVLTKDNIGNLGFNDHALVYAPSGFDGTGLTNVIYGSEGDMRCDNLVISDSIDFVVPGEFKAAAITYDRQFAEGGIETICLPFNMEVPAGANAYMLTETETNCVTVSRVYDFVANRPHIIVTEKDMTLKVNDETLVPVTPSRLQQVSGRNYAMLGTLESISEDYAKKQAMYILGKDVIWHKMEESTEGALALSSYRVYMQATMSGMPNAVQMIFDDNVYNIFTGSSAWSESGNWSNGVPTSMDNALILGNVKLDKGSIHINDLLINDGAITIEEGASITINGKIKNTDASSLIISDGAELFVNNTTTRSNDNIHATFNMGIVNPEVWGETGSMDGWQFISSPFVDAPISCFTEVEDNYDLYKYDGSAEQQWLNHKSGSFCENTFVSGTAYLASYETMDIATLVGTVNLATGFTKSLTYTEGSELANFHLVGNPFTFNMDMSRAQTEGLASGYAIIGSDGAYIYAPSDTTIAVGDGFYVKAIADNPEFSYNHKNAAQETRSGGRQISSINVIASGKAGKDNVLVNFTGKSEGFDKLQNFNDAIAKVYVSDNGKPYGIANVDENTTEVELSFEAKDMGQYSIMMDVNGDFETVTLVDRLANVEIDMLAENRYDFIATSSDNAKRFVIRLSDVQQSAANIQFAYINNNDIIITNIEGNAQINVFDALGRCVYNGECCDAMGRISIDGFTSGVYVIQKADDNGVNVQKIILE